MSSSLHPTEGIRLLLERETISDDRQSARYQATIYTVDQSFHYGCTLGLDGSAEMAADGDEADAKDAESLGKLARSTARAAKRKLEEDLPPWPPRILRWRGPGRG